jgi:hypothetical protein
LKSNQPTTSCLRLCLCPKRNLKQDFNEENLLLSILFSVHLKIVHPEATPVSTASRPVRGSLPVKCFRFYLSTVAPPTSVRRTRAGVPKNACITGVKEVSCPRCVIPLPFRPLSCERSFYSASTVGGPIFIGRLATFGNLDNRGFFTPTPIKEWTRRSWSLMKPGRLAGFCDRRVPAEEHFRFDTDPL